MGQRKEALIVILIFCIMFTPILICAGVKGLGGLVFMWLIFALYWYLFYGKDAVAYDKSKKNIEERRVEFKNGEKIYNESLPLRLKERESQRRALGLVTDRSFREYIGRFGFQIEGTIDIGDLPSWTQYYYGNHVEPSRKVRPSTIKIITHKSYDQLKMMGIYNVRQLLGDYHKYFNYYIDNKYGGFVKETIEKYDDGFNKIKSLDSNNMVCMVQYCVDYDKNIEVVWNKDYIYFIGKKSCNQINGELQYQYVIYRDTGIVTRNYASELSEDERNFILLAKAHEKNRNQIKNGVCLLNLAGDKMLGLSEYSEGYMIDNSSLSLLY